MEHLPKLRAIVEDSRAYQRIKKFAVKKCKDPGETLCSLTEDIKTKYADDC